MAQGFCIYLLLIFGICNATKEKNKQDVKPQSTLGYFPKYDGIKCDQKDWVESAVDHPILVSNQGKVKGQHRCKLNRRYANPAVTEGMGPKQFEGDSFYNVPYAKHVRRYDYGRVD